MALAILPLSVVMVPAIKLAREGCPLNEKQAYIFQLLEPIFTHSAEGQALFCRNGNILSAGELFINTDFADFH